MKFYSKSANAFYDDAINAVMPPDAQQITDAQWQAALDGQAQGKTITADADGMPVAIDVAPTLAQAQAAQIGRLSVACQAQILAGFISSALGTAHTYPAKPTDQQNLTASVVASLMPGLSAGWSTPFWCEDSSGAWAYVNHTAAQIQQAGQDGKAAILAALSKNATLAAQVAAATTVTAVQAIVW